MVEYLPWDVQEIVRRSHIRGSVKKLFICIRNRRSTVRNLRKESSTKRRHTGEVVWVGVCRVFWGLKNHGPS